MASGKLKKSDAPALNIQAYIRVRPLAAKEKKSPTLEFGRRDVTIKCGGEACRTKTLTYDRVFEEDVKQVAVYSAVVKPMIKEVLAGYNCTVFAYGQTGTGKTYTMTGEQGDPSLSWEDNIHAGIIPRAMEDIFAELANQTAEYQVTVSYMELYNEKLGSLISDTPEDDQNIQLIDDLEGGILLRGLTPTPVKNRDDAFQLLRKGAERRHVASTMMNHNSSRSHTIFTINVNIKESVMGEKEDVLRVGKLHLVDLAGSENVSKSGASEKSNKSATGVNKRLAEASNINKSLLTLGRVITSIVENNPHIPYRESKLTRFLRDSLGGKTKTCIIGTISPHQANIDETESTLNYAYKARSIKNKPEKNQKISKKEFMQVASEEIMKLKRDLDAMRHGDGFYISKETHEEMTENMKQLDIQAKDWSERYNALSEQYEQNKEMFTSLSADFDDKCAEYDELDKMYQTECEKFKEKFKEVQQEIVVREYLINQYAKTEDKLTQQAKTCQSVVENLISTSSLLHDKIERKQTSQMGNIEALDKFKESLKTKLQVCGNEVEHFFSSQRTLTRQICIFTGKIVDELGDQNQNLLKVVNNYVSMLRKYYKDLAEIQKNMKVQLDREETTASALMREGMLNQVNSLTNIASYVINPITAEFNTTMADIMTRLHNNESIYKGFLDTASVLDEGLASSRQLFATTTDLLVDELTDILNNLFVETTRVDESKMAVKQVTLKAQEMKGSVIKVLADLESLMVKAKEAEDMVNDQEDRMCDNVKKVFEYKNLLENKVASYTADLLHVHDNVIGDFKSVNTYHRNMLNEATTGYQSLDFLRNKLIQELNGSVGNLLSGLREHYIMEKDNLTETYKKFYNSSTFAENKVQSCAGNTEAMWSILCDNIRLREQEMERDLREEHRHLSEESRKAKTAEKSLKIQFSTIENEVSGMAYKMDAPLGTTPARITKKDVKYPKQLIATAPRPELLAKFKQSEEEETLGQTLSGSVRQESPVAAKDLEGKQDIDREVQLQQLTMSARPHRVPLSLGHSRRSRSMPDVTAEITQKPDDDKENTSIIVNAQNKAGVKKKSPSLKPQKSPVRRIPLKASNHTKTSKNSAVKS